MSSFVTRRAENDGPVLWLVEPRDLIGNYSPIVWLKLIAIRTDDAVKRVLSLSKGLALEPNEAAARANKVITERDLPVSEKKHFPLHSMWFFHLTDAR